MNREGSCFFLLLIVLFCWSRSRVGVLLYVDFHSSTRFHRTNFTLARPQCNIGWHID